MIPTRSIAMLLLVLTVRASAQAPNTNDLKRALDKQLQALKPQGYATRTVLFGDVRAGPPNGAFFPFQVTATIHDYGLGYPKNRFYGATCVGTMDKWKFDMRKDDVGGWLVQGRMTVSDALCKDNPAEGVSSQPLAALSGTRAPAAGAVGAAKSATPADAGSKPYLGQYACYGTGGRIMAGMGIVLKANGAYEDLDRARKGSYVHNAAAATLFFKGGFLDGQTGRNVKMTGFALSETVNCEPWR